MTFENLKEGFATDEKTVTHEIAGTMTRTILDTCTNANAIFYQQLKDVKLNTKSTANQAKDKVLQDMAQDERMFEAFKLTVESM